MWFTRFQIYNTWTTKHLAQASCTELTLQWLVVVFLVVFLKGDKLAALIKIKKLYFGFFVYFDSQTKNISSADQKNAYFVK